MFYSQCGVWHQLHSVFKPQSSTNANFHLHASVQDHSKITHASGVFSWWCEHSFNKTQQCRLTGNKLLLNLQHCMSYQHAPVSELLHHVYFSQDTEINVLTTFISATHILVRWCSSAHVTYLSKLNTDGAWRTRYLMNMNTYFKSSQLKAAGRVEGVRLLKVWKQCSREEDAEFVWTTYW